MSWKIGESTKAQYAERDRDLRVVSRKGGQWIAQRFEGRNPNDRMVRMVDDGWRDLQNRPTDYQAAITVRDQAVKAKA